MLMALAPATAVAAPHPHDRVAQRRAGVAVICHRGASEFAHENTLDAYRATWPPFFEYQRRGALFELVELEVTAGDTVAFAHALLRCGTPAELDNHPDNRLRLTIGLRKHDDRWIVAHEHHSFAAA